MIRNRVSWGYGLMALVLLTFGLAACGGDEPAPVVQPPAPPPAPPPFQPQPVEVALGESGENVTLMTTEAGGFTLNGEDFKSGTAVTADNGNMYTLVLADGTWTAKFDAHEVVIDLGITEEMVTITRAEDGTWWYGEEAVVSGETTVTAANGNMYTLMIGTDEGGAIVWMANYVKVMRDVMLGLSGETLTLVRAEDGTYWDGNALVEDGYVATAANGNMYRLMMEEHDDHVDWVASYVDVTGTVTVGTRNVIPPIPATRDEHGTWTATHPLTGETITLTEGATVEAAGYTYMLSMTEDGNWMASFVNIERMAMLGDMGGTITLVQIEDGTWWHGTDEVMDGSTVMVEHGEYTLMMAEDGTWSGSFVNVEQMVDLGDAGGPITLVQIEDGTWWYGELEVMEGDTITSGVNGQDYVVSMDEDGMWMGMYDRTATGRMQVVDLGSSGSTVTITMEENGTYTYSMDDGEAMMLTSGMTVMAENGDEYELTLTDGAWSDSFKAKYKVVMGTGGETVMSIEGEEGYDADGDGMAELDASGTGDVTAEDGRMYHVMMNEDGMLVGVQYDTAIHAATDQNLRIALPTLEGDDPDTDANELGTKLVLNDEKFPIGALLNDGTSSLAGDNFVKEALEGVQALRDAVSAYIALDATDDDTGDYDSQIRALWNDQAQAEVNAIFGTFDDDDNEATPEVPLAKLDTLGPNDDAEDAVAAFDALLTALGSPDAFVAATVDDSDEVLEAAKLGEDEAREIFDAVESMSMAGLGETTNTRFGAYWKQERALAKADLMHVDADQDTDGDPEDTTDADETDGDMGKIGAFAYSLIDDVTKTIDLPTSGSLYYEGETIAVTSGASPKFYSGKIQIEVQLVNQRVHGLVTELKDAEEKPWTYQFGEVESIRLSPANLGANANWNQSLGRANSDDSAYINFASRPGSSPSAEVDGGFVGWLTGQEDTEDPARAAHGTWWIAESQGATDNSNTDGLGNQNLLTAGYGAEKGDPPPEIRPPEAAIDESKSSVLPAAGTDGDQRSVTINDDGELVIKRDPDTNVEGSDVTTIKLAISSFKLNDEKTIDDALHVTEVVKFIEQQKAVLEGWIALDETSDDDSNNTTTLTGRNAVWTAIRNRLIGENGLGGTMSRIFTAPGDRNDVSTDGPANDGIDPYNLMAGGVDADGNPTFTNTDYPRDGADPDDVKGLSVIDEILEALSTADEFADALKDGGIFHDGDAFTTVSASDIFAREVSRTKVYFAMTDYTRFGAWRLQTHANAEGAVTDVNGLATEDANGGNADGPAAFAFSPLETTKYTSFDDPSIPGSGARYTGGTVAVQRTVFYEGTIEIVVDWDMDPAWTTTDLTVTISDLVDVNGVALTHGNNDVGQIVLFQEDATDRNADNELIVTMTDTALDSERIVFANRRTVDIDAGITASLDGKFVGKTIEGPVGIIGTWNVQHANLGNGGTLRGGFGAEYAGRP